MIAFPEISFPIDKGKMYLVISSPSKTSLIVTGSTFSFGTSIPINEVFGIGAIRRSEAAASAKPKSLDKPSIFENLIPGAKSRLYLVTEGP